MSLNNHPDYHEELQRLNYTVEYVNNVILAMDTKRSEYNEEMRQDISISIFWIAV